VTFACGEDLARFGMSEIERIKEAGLKNPASGHFGLCESMALGLRPRIALSSIDLT
jgi:hypothetical protein